MSDLSDNSSPASRRLLAGGTRPVILAVLLLAIITVVVVLVGRAYVVGRLIHTIAVAQGGRCFDDLSDAASLVKRWNAVESAKRRVLEQLRCDNPHFTNALYVLGELDDWDPEVDRTLLRISEAEECTSAQQADARFILEALRKSRLN